MSQASRSTIIHQAMVAGLEAERQALIQMQEAEIEAEILHAEEERKAALEIRKARQKADLLSMEEEIAKVKAVEEIYKEEELKRETLQDHENQSRASWMSRVSSRSSVAKRAELAGLKAEMDAKKKTQEAELFAEQLKSDA